MFNLENYYEQCESGNVVDNSEVFDYIRLYEKVAIWGASFQGKAVGQRLLDENIVFDYWDLRADELVTVNGIKVIKPFTEEYVKDQTLVIYCIPNHVIMDRLLSQLRNAGYKNIIRGDILYSGIVCPLTNQTGLSAQRCWETKECRSVICGKVKNILKNKNQVKKPGERIDFQYSVFVINSICNLSCKDCVQFVNNYPVDKRNNVPYEIIERDIDSFMTTIDTVGTISVMGGETFLHPEIGRIVQKFCEYDNFAFLSLPTNGLVEIKPEQLEPIKDKRIIIAFGYYLHIANEEQKQIYKKNVELVKSYGISYTESQQLPTWIETSSLKKLNVNEEYMEMKKQVCKMPPRNLQVKNGKIHVCDSSLALHNMGLVDYPTDYLDITQQCSLEEMRNQLRELIDRPFYFSCGHCYGSGKMVPSALQGIKDPFVISKEFYEKFGRYVEK